MGVFLRHIMALFKKGGHRHNFTESRKVTEKYAFHDALVPLKQDLELLKNELALLKKLLESQHWRIEKFHVDRMHVEQFTIELENITVDQLGGALNVGITHSCLVTRGNMPFKKEPEGGKDPQELLPQTREGYILTFHPQS
ncbi:hypothetical protein [Desulfofundulus sp.]|uniref:hypothetical protein n=1 Tax=Desulfofundulus sp. TaxID=2282750 RepID=UPI003C718B69